MINNKNHWYDGWFYDKIIAPNQDVLFEEIKTLIDSQSEILDVGCGTGRLAFTLAEKCKSVLGIDLSERNIKRAQQTLHKYPDSKVSFQHCNLSEINFEGQKHFDYAVLTYVIHEVNENERIELLTELARVADKIIIGDYPVPKPKGPGSILTEIIEFIAGKDHYRNFKSYVANGGIHYLAVKSGLKIIKDNNCKTLDKHLVVLTAK